MVALWNMLLYESLLNFFFLMFFVPCPDFTENATHRLLIIKLNYCLLVFHQAGYELR
jgi:hypothetical protein